MFLDIGALVVISLAALAFASLFVHIPPVEGQLGVVLKYANPLAIPAAFFCFYVLWHMLKTRHWGWFVASFLLAPFTFVGYYLLVVRRQLSLRSTQLGTQADTLRAPLS